MANDIPRTPEEYREELLRLYQNAHPEKHTAETKTPSDPEVIPKPELPPEPAVLPEPEISPEPEVIPEPKLPAEPEILPEPSISEPASPTPIAAPESAVTQTAIGWIQVITRTGGNGLALPNVSVVVTGGSGQALELEHVTITNESGETEKIPLPVPDVSLSLDQNEQRQPYSTYDVCVNASGFYPQTSHNVPVFSGITSRQIFAMIPLPNDAQEAPEPITFENPEPDFRA